MSSRHNAITGGSRAIGDMDNVVNNGCTPEGKQAALYPTAMNRCPRCTRRQQEREIPTGAYVYVSTYCSAVNTLTNTSRSNLTSLPSIDRSTMPQPTAAKPNFGRVAAKPPKIFTASRKTTRKRQKAVKQPQNSRLAANNIYSVHTAFITRSVCVELQLPMCWPGLLNSCCELQFSIFLQRQKMSKFDLFGIHLAVNFVRCDSLAEKVRFRCFLAKPKSSRKFLKTSRILEKNSASCKPIDGPLHSHFFFLLLKLSI